MKPDASLWRKLRGTLGMAQHTLRNSLAKAVLPPGSCVVDARHLYAWQKLPPQGKGHAETPLPAGASEYLRADHPRLQELRARYVAFDPRATTPFMWTENHLSASELRYFRGDNAFVWQVREPGLNEMAYALSTYYVHAIDHLGLLDQLVEDGQFGVHSFRAMDRLVSRDLLDSICEIYFLERQLGILSRPISVLDIGAGYGRLAHRMSCVAKQLQHYWCADAFAASTFVCEYYLKHLGITQASAVPLDVLANTIKIGSVELAINIHSFSECRLEAIDWWLEFIAAREVRYLMIVPNTGKALHTNAGYDFAPLIQQHGYRLRVRESKYQDPQVQAYGINPSQYFLFELNGKSASAKGRV